MRQATPRRYLMCEPRYFDVTYSINPWMDPEVPISRHLALQQWDKLRATLERLGHKVDVMDPVPGLPDMVFTANAGLVLDGIAYPARMMHPERAGEEEHFARWCEQQGLQLVPAQAVNEGEADLPPVGPYVLTAWGQRTTPAASQEVSDVFARPIVPLHLVDPRFYHMDAALAVLDDTTIAYYPQAFAPASARKLARLFPDAIVAAEEDALAFGLNMISDGRNVVVSPAAPSIAAALRARGFNPIAVDTSEFLRSGGGAKCCVMEVRA